MTVKGTGVLVFSNIGKPVCFFNLLKDESKFQMPDGVPNRNAPVPVDGLFLPFKRILSQFSDTVTP